jgi:hypothetical protein
MNIDIPIEPNEGNVIRWAHSPLVARMNDNFIVTNSNGLCTGNVLSISVNVCRLNALLALLFIRLTKNDFSSELETNVRIHG